MKKLKNILVRTLIVVLLFARVRLNVQYWRRTQTQEHSWYYFDFCSFRMICAAESDSAQPS